MAGTSHAGRHSGGYSVNTLRLANLLDAEIRLRGWDVFAVAASRVRSARILCG